MKNRAILLSTFVVASLLLSEVFKLFDEEYYKVLGGVSGLLICVFVNNHLQRKSS